MLLLITDAVQLPKGTHQWSSFLTPEELVLILQRASINVRWMLSVLTFWHVYYCYFLVKTYCLGFGARQVKEMAGFVYSPLTGRWSLSDDISVNFIAFGTKDGHWRVAYKDRHADKKLLLLGILFTHSMLLSSQIISILLSSLLVLNVSIKKQNASETILKPTNLSHNKEL